MKVGIVLGWFRAQKETNSTTWLAVEAWNRGHEVWFVDFLRFGLDARGQVLAVAARPVHAGPQITRAQLVRALQTGQLREETKVLSGFDVVFLRNNPNDRTSSWGDKVGNPGVTFGRLLEQAGVYVVNSPARLDECASVLYLADLPAEMRPRTCVSREERDLRAFVSDLGGPAVLKPLHGAGGTGVFRVEGADDRNFATIVDTLKTMGYVVAQEYLPEAANGDKRVVLWEGRLLPTAPGYWSAYRRVHRRDDFRNNIHAGGSRERTLLTERERAVVDRIGPRLKRDGVRLAGVDLAGERLLEVNVYAPGGIHNVNVLYDVNIAAPILADLEARTALGGRPLAAAGRGGTTDPARPR